MQSSLTSSQLKVFNHLIRFIANLSNYSEDSFTLILGDPGSRKSYVLKAFQKHTHLTKSNVFEFSSPWGIPAMILKGQTLFTLLSIDPAGIGH